MRFLQNYPLDYAEDCRLLGIGQQGDLYVEEIYGDDWFAQHHFAPDGRRIASIDEHYGRVDARSLSLPPTLITPSIRDLDDSWTFVGGRARGLRIEERISDLLQPLSIAERAYLSAQIHPSIAPGQWLGISARLPRAVAHVAPSLLLVCSKVQIAYALLSPAVDAHRMLYDYDTITLFLLQSYDVQVKEKPPVSVSLKEIDGQPLYRPLDCLVFNGRLYVADGGANDRKSAIRVWEIEP